MQHLFCFMAMLLLSLVFACKADHSSTGNSGTTTDSTSIEQPSKGFDELSSDYYETQSRLIWQKPDLILNLLGDLNGKTVADIGAGTGFFSFRLASAGAKVIAVDIDQRAIDWIETEKARYPDTVDQLLETRLATPEDPNLDAQEADVLLLVNTYIYLGDRVNYFRNLRNVLREGGKVVIVDFKAQETPVGPPLNERVPLTRVQSELEKAGYAVLTADESSLEYQYIVTAQLR